MSRKKQPRQKTRANGAPTEAGASPAPQTADPETDEPFHEPEVERKDHVLQTRVPKNLYDELVEKAQRLRVPVSNLVRNILEDSVRMVENIVDNSLDIAETFSEKARKKDLTRVLGWQPLIANRKLVCSQCHASIQKGEEAFVGIGAPGDRNFILCQTCKSEM